MSDLLTLTEHHDGKTVVLALSGEADLATAPPIGDRVRELLAAGARRLQLDLTDLGFMDSTAVGVLLRARRDSESAGVTFDVVCPDGPARRVLHLLGLLPTFGLSGAAERGLDPASIA